MQKYDKGGVVAWVFLGGAAVFLIALFVFSVNNKAPSLHLKDAPWRKEMYLGEADAPNKFVRYTDYFCPYCADLQQETSSDKFRKEYVDSGKVGYEARIITVLSEQSVNTDQGAEAAHCAADQDKFWEYSDDIVPRIKEDFFDKGIGVKNVANPKQIEKLDIAYFQKSAKTANMDVDKFTTCVKNKTHAKQIEKDTQKAINYGVTGLPYVAINDFSTSGFQGGWQGLELLLKQGGVQ